MKPNDIMFIIDLWRNTKIFSVTDSTLFVAIYTMHYRVWTTPVFVYANTDGNINSSVERGKGWVGIRH